MMKKDIKIKCNHDFRYSHIECPDMLYNTNTTIPQNKDVVVCRKCGMIIKTIKI